MFTKESLQRRIEAPDQYGVVLVLILIALISVALLGEGPFGQLLSVLLIGGILLFGIHTSRAPARVFGIAVSLLALTLITSFAAQLGGRTATLRGLASASTGLLVIATPIVIGRRLAIEPEVTLQKVLGALCIYLLLGLFFAYLFGFLNEVGAQEFFAQRTHPSPVDFIYFSYTTLTTVGYGDLTARTGPGRMLAVTEALTGQLYLVTVVAVLVSQMTANRRNRN